MTLQDSQWAKFHHDLKNTGRSPYPSNSIGDLKWTFLAGGTINSSPAIDSNGVIYFGCDDGNLYAINPDGSLKWTFPTGTAIGIVSPAIDSDGTIYIGGGAGNNNLYAINPDGTQKWVFVSTQGAFDRSSPNIGTDGTIFAAVGTSVEEGLYAINPNGTQKWFDDISWPKAVNSSAIDGSGDIYTTYNDLGSYVIKAVHSNGGFKWWSFPGDVFVASSPSIDSNAVYFGDDNNILHALNISDGSFKWDFPVGGAIRSSAAIDSNGIIYIGSGNGKLYAINPNGTQKWNFTTGGAIIGSSPAIDSNGVIYVGSNDGNLYAINPDGSLKWNYPSGGIINSSPAIDSNGVIYVGSGSSLISIKSPVSGIDLGKSSIRSTGASVSGGIACGKGKKR